MKYNYLLLVCDIVTVKSGKTFFERAKNKNGRSAIN